MLEWAASNLPGRSGFRAGPTHRALHASFPGRGQTLDRTQALERFLVATEQRAFRMAQIATGDVDEALDLVQEAMFKLAQRYASRDEKEWGPLFHRIMQSKIRDWYRRVRIRHQWRQWFGGRAGDEDSDPLEAVPDEKTPGLDQQVSERQVAHALDSALQALPLRQQQAFLLRVWEEFDVNQTARAMGCSEGSVKTHYARAVRALRARLGDHWP